MKADLEAAARVQQTLLPVGLPAVPGVTRAWRYRSCDELAGDAVNIFLVDDRHLCLYVLDVSGHGMPASLPSVSVSRSLTVHADRSSLVRVPREDGTGFRVAGAAEVASRLNVIYPMAIGDAGLYFTFCYGILDLETNRFSYVCAGHPGPLLLRGGTARSINVPSLPIGMFANAQYRETTIGLCPGDRIYIYSDGLTLEENLDALMDELAVWRGNNRFTDDVTLAALQIDLQ